MKYNFNEKRLCMVFDFYENPNQTIKQLAARHQTNVSNANRTLTEFFRLRPQDKEALIKRKKKKTLT